MARSNDGEVPVVERRHFYDFEAFRPAIRSIVVDIASGRYSPAHNTIDLGLSDPRRRQNRFCVRISLNPYTQFGVFVHPCRLGSRVAAGVWLT